jgi:hypothetical protein
MSPGQSILISEDSLLQRVNSVVSAFGCSAVKLGQNDKRAVVRGHVVFGPLVYVSFPARFSRDYQDEIGQMVIEEVSGITKVVPHRQEHSY